MVYQAARGGNHILLNIDCKFKRGAIKEVSSDKNGIARSGSGAGRRKRRARPPRSPRRGAGSIW